MKITDWLRRINWRAAALYWRLARWWKFRGLPADLQKACEDHFEYALGLKDGTVFYFYEARREGEEWLHLSDIQGHNARKLLHPMEWRTSRIDDAFTFDRGVTVRVSDISWIADAPFGS